MSKERIQKALARQGLGSRRQIESWIKEGLVRMNGKVIELGQHVEVGDVVMYNGRKIPIRDIEQTLPRVIAYNKPEGEVCSRSDPEGRPTIFDKLPGLKHSRWIAVGRLDINTSGLILLTDNGDLANALMHPSNQLQREYAVRVMGQASPQQLKKLTHGVELEDGTARFEDIVETTFDDEFFPRQSGLNHWYHVVLMEGRNREVRRMWDAVELKVSRLMRVRYGSVMLPKGQRPGRYHELDAKEIRELAELAGIHYAKDVKSAKPLMDDRRKHKPRALTNARGGARASSRGASRDTAKAGKKNTQRPYSKTPASGASGNTNRRRKTAHDKRR